MKIRFISIDQEQISVKLDSIGELLESGFTYKTDSVAQTNYTIGSLIAADQYIEFEFDNVSKDSSNYYQFATSGADIKLSGALESNQNYAFYNLFKNCNNIVDASQLSVGEGVGKYSHANLFESCTKLTTPPTSLASGQLKDWCYSGIFNRCSSLTGVPALPSNDLALCCYNSMFYNCKSLQTAPILSATTLAPFCYNSMFNCCNSLTGITLLASTLVNGCYKNMFMDCKSLSSITVAFTEWNENYTGNWVKGVGPYGTFNRPNDLAEQYGNSKIPLGWDRVLQTITVDQIPTILFDENNTSASLVEYVHYTGILPLYYMINGQLPAGITFEDGVFYYDSDQFEGSNSFKVDFIAYASDAKAVVTTITINILKFDENSPLTFVGKDSSNAVALSSVGSPKRVNLQYSKNDGQWQDYTINEVITFDQNDTIAFSGANDHFSKAYNSYYRFKMSGIIESYGNIQSLMNFSDSCTSSCYVYLFSGCDNLISAPLMPATTLAQGCYAYTFYNCSSLVDAPELPATQLCGGCYQNMFQNCHSLTSAPELPAFSVPAYAYYGMFSKCHSLSTAPQLPATELGRQSYQTMFYLCSSLIQAPQISATTLATNCCYGMFQNCKNLVTAPSVLPAITLVQGCYAWMFRECSSLLNAPYLPAEHFPSLPPNSTGPYRSMFAHCSSLSSINVELKEWGSYENTDAWVLGVAESGIFYKPEQLTERYEANSFIPSGWTVVNTNQ